MDIEIYNWGVRNAGPQAEPLAIRAIELLRARKAVEAETVIKQALEIEPNNPLLLNNLSSAYLFQGQKQKAEQMAYEIHRRFPDYLFGRINVANLLIDKGEIDEAARLIAPLISRKRFHVSEFTALCGVQINLSLAHSDRHSAQAWLDLLEEADPDDPNIPAYRLRVKPSVKNFLRAIFRRW